MALAPEAGAQRGCSTAPGHTAQPHQEPRPQGPTPRAAVTLPTEATPSRCLAARFSTTCFPARKSRKNHGAKPHASVSIVKVAWPGPLYRFYFSSSSRSEPAPALATRRDVFQGRREGCSPWLGTGEVRGESGSRLIGDQRGLGAAGGQRRDGFQPGRRSRAHSPAGPCALQNRGAAVLCRRAPCSNSCARYGPLQFLVPGTSISPRLVGDVELMARSSSVILNSKAEICYPGPECSERDLVRDRRGDARRGAAS